MSSAVGHQASGVALPFMRPTVAERRPARKTSQTTKTGIVSPCVCVPMRLPHASLFDKRIDVFVTLLIVAGVASASWLGLRATLAWFAMIGPFVATYMMLTRIRSKNYPREEPGASQSITDVPPGF